MIEITKEKKYWLVELNRPDVHNAFHPEMIEALTNVYQEASKQEGLQLVLLKGRGKSFSAGADLNWMKDMASFSKTENQEDALKLFDMFYAMYSCQVPTMAYVHGNVFGGGLGLVAVQDMVVAEEETKFCFSEVKWGLSPATISPFLMAKIGNTYSLKYMLGAEVFSANRAKEIGLVHDVAKEEEAKEIVYKATKAILNHGREALLATKKTLRNQSIDPNQFRDETAQLIAERRVSQEGQEGLNFFITKEMPSWKEDVEGIKL